MYALHNIGNCIVIGKGLIEQVKYGLNAMAQVELEYQQTLLIFYVVWTKGPQSYRALGRILPSFLLSTIHPAFSMLSGHLSLVAIQFLPRRL